MKPSYADLEKKIKEFENNEATLNTAFNNIQQLFITFDENYKVVLVNELAGKYANSLFGGEVIAGKSSIDEIFPKDVAFAFRDYLGKSFQGKTIAGDVEISYNKNNFWFNYSCSPVKQKKDGIKRVVLSLIEVTGRKSSLIALKESEEKYRNIVELSPDGIVTLALDGEIKSVNRVFTEMTGYEENDFVGKKIEEIPINPLPYMGTMDEVLGRISGGEIINLIEFQWVHKNGNRREGEAKVSKVEGSGSKDILQCIVRDITDSKEKEALILQEKNRAQQYLDMAGSMFIMIMADETISIANQTACKILGYKEEELVGKNWFETCIPKSERDVVRNVFDQLILGEIEPVEYFENRIVKKSGEERVVAWHNAVIRNEEGEIISVLGSGDDITDKVEAKQELLRNYSSLKQAEKIGNLGYFERDWQTGKGYWSEGFKELLGANPDELVPEHSDFMNYIYVDDRDRVKKHLYETIEENKLIDIDFKLTKKSGTIIDIHCIASNFYDEKGKILFTRGVFRDITHKRKSEQKLIQSEKKYRTLVNSYLQGVVIAQGDPVRISFANPTMESILGYTVEELESLKPDKIEELIHLEDKSRFFTNFQNRLAGKKVDPVVEYRFITKKGVERWVRAHSTVMEYENSPATLTSFIDITDTKSAEERLIKSEEKYLHLVENSADMIGIAQGNNLRFANTALLKKLGYRMNEIEAIEFMDLIHPEYRKMVADRYVRRLKGEDVPVQYNFKVLRKDKKSFWVEIISTVTNWEDKPAVLFFLRDVEERLKSEKMLRESEEKYRIVAEKTGQLIYDYDVGSGIINWDGDVLGLTGFSFEDFQKVDIEKWSEMLHPDDRKGALAQLQRSNDVVGTYDYEYRFKHKDGHYIFIESRGVFIPNDNGKSFRMYGSMKDVTERKNAEKTILESESRYRRLFERSADATMILDYDTFIDCNDSTPLFFKVDSKDVIIGKNPWDISPEKQPDGQFSKEKALMHIDYAIENGASRFQWLHLDENKNPLWADIALTHMPELGKNRVQGVLRDITDKVEAERLLQESYEIINQSPVVVFLWKNVAGWPVEFVTDNVKEVFGYTKEEFMSARISYDKTIHQEDLPRVFEEVTSNSEKPGLKGFNHEPYRIITKKGKEIWLDDRTIIRRDRNGNITHYQGVIIDITYKMASAKALKESESKYRELFENVTNGFSLHEMIYDEKGTPFDYKFLEVNPAFERMTGLKNKNIVNKTVLEVLPKTEKYWIERYGQVVRTKRPIEFEDYSEELDRYYSVLAYCPREDHFATIFSDVTESRKKEIALEESEKKFKAIFDNVNVGIIGADMETKKFLFGNNAILYITGYKLIELTRIGVPDFHPKESLPYVVECFEKQVRGELPVASNLPVLCKDGSVKYFDIRSTVENISGRKVLLGIFTDITEERRKEIALKESEKRYRMITENANDVIWTCDVEGRFLYVSPSVKKMRGYTSEEILTQNVETTVCEDSLIVVQQALRNVVELVLSGKTEIEPIIVEVEQPCKNGSTIWTESSVDAIFNEEGKFQFFLGVTRDVSERRVAEQKIKSTNEKLENLIKNLPGLVYRCYNDENFTMTFLSDGCERLTGYDKSDLLFNKRKSFKEIIHKDDLKLVRETVSNAIQKKEPYDIYYRIKTKSGNIKWVWEKGLAIYNRRGGVHRLEGYIADVTEEKESRIKIIESQAKFREFAELLPQAVFEMDLTGKFTFLNNYSFEMFGYTQKEFYELGNHLKLLFSEEEFKRVKDMISDLIGGDKGEEGLEYTALKKDGAVLPVAVYSHLVQKDGKPVGIRGITVNISERKKAEKKVNDLLKETQRQKEEITLLLTGARHVLENDDFEPTARKLFDYCRELTGAATGYMAILNENGGKNKVLFLDPDQYDYSLYQSLPMPFQREGREADKNQEAVYNNDFMNSEWAKYIPKGHPELRNVLFAPLNFGDETVGLLGLSNKLTDFTPDDARVANAFGELASIALRNSRNYENLIKANKETKLNIKRLEGLLNISHFKFEKVQDLLDQSLKEAISLTSSDIGFIFYYNEKGKLFNLNTWSKKVMKECGVPDYKLIYHLEDTGCWGDAVRKRGPVIINDYSPDHPDSKGTPTGHMKINKFMSIPVFADHEIKAVIGVANKVEDYDQTDVKQLTLLMNTVWKVVEKESMNLKLIEAKEKAEESDRLKSAFLSNMSHEIRTPLNGIVGFADLLRTPELPADQMSKYIDVINSSGNQLLNIITDIVDISKIEANQIRIEKNAFNLNEKLSEIEMFFSESANYNNDKNVELKFYKQLPDKESILVSDSLRFEQIVLNLIKNAFKFTHKGSIEIGYKLQVEDQLLFYVKDTGIGVPQNKIDLIFARFRQADDSHSRKYGGTGLGLSISKSLIELLGGKIWAESEEGVGTTFYFSLPYETEKAVPKTVEKERPEAVLLKGKKILIVEDEEASCQYYKAIFKPSKAELYFAETGQDAVRIVKEQNDLSIVLMDIQLPGMNGYEATENIKKLKPELPIIVQSANAFQEDKVRAFKTGCDDYIAKPINKVKLMDMIKKWIK